MRSVIVRTRGPVSYRSNARTRTPARSLRLSTILVNAGNFECSARLPASFWTLRGPWDPDSQEGIGHSIFSFWMLNIRGQLFAIPSCCGEESPGNDCFHAVRSGPKSFFLPLSSDSIAADEHVPHGACTSSTLSFSQSHGFCVCPRSADG